MSYWEKQCYKLIYQDLLNYIKSQGIRVVHKNKIKDKTWGEYFPRSSLITISSKLDDYEKITTLAHEFYHYKDHKRGVFYNYLNTDDFNLKEIREAEISASRQGQKLLMKRYGIKFEYDELTTSGIIYLSFQWKKTYNL